MEKEECKKFRTTFKNPFILLLTYDLCSMNFPNIFLARKKCMDSARREFCSSKSVNYRFSKIFLRGIKCCCINLWIYSPKTSPVWIAFFWIFCSKIAVTIWYMWDKKVIEKYVHEKRNNFSEENRNPNGNILRYTKKLLTRWQTHTHTQ